LLSGFVLDLPELLVEQLGGGHRGLLLGLARRSRQERGRGVQHPRAAAEPLRYARHVLDRAFAVWIAVSRAVARFGAAATGERGTHRARAAHTAHRRDHRRYRLLACRVAVARSAENTGRVLRGLAARGQLRDAGQLRVGGDVGGLQRRWPVDARDVAEPTDDTATAACAAQGRRHTHATDVVAVAEASCDVGQLAGERVAARTRGDALVVEPGDRARHRADGHQRTVLRAVLSAVQPAVHPAEAVDTTRAEVARAVRQGRVHRTAD